MRVGDREKETERENTYNVEVDRRYTYIVAKRKTVRTFLRQQLGRSLVFNGMSEKRVKNAQRMEEHRSAGRVNWMNRTRPPVGRGVRQNRERRNKKQSRRKEKKMM